MKASTALRAKVMVIVLSLVFAPLALPQAGVVAQGQVAAGKETIHLPLLGAPHGPPDFTILSPTPGSSVSGTSLFAIQPAEAGQITSVDFQAGGTDLGADSSAADGLQAFLDVSALPAGPLQLSATASGPSGRTTKTVNVTVVAKPAASATVGATGATLATTSTGSLIIVPPGAAPPGTKITVQDKTREQTTEEDGIDWDAIGVTFLGAIDVQANGPITRPLEVTSMGFGNRLQQGQKVVTYRILPDADGDGVGELVVVNGANVAPNGALVSSPIPQLTVNSMVCTQGVNVASQAGVQSGAGGAATQPLHGAPGALITIHGGGFNPNALQGNVATFHSLVNGQTLNVPAQVEQNGADANDQTVSVLVPVFPAGAATLLLRNESTGSTSGPYNLTVDAAPQLSGPAGDIIDSFFAQSLGVIATLPADNAEQAAQKTTITDNFTQMRAAFANLGKDSAPDIQQYLHDTATIIEGSGVISSAAALNIANSSAVQVQCVTPEQRNFVNTALNVVQNMFVVGCTLLAVGPKSPLLATACNFFFSQFVNFDRYLLGTKPTCPSQTPTTPAACSPTNTAQGAGKTGMGSAPPPGGNACGNAGGGPNISVQSATVGATNGETNAGRFIVKIFTASGDKLLTPFTGASDPGGYFFIPLIPQHEPFRALALDEETGASVSVTGTGPVEGDSVRLDFDFSKAAQNLYPIAIGDTVSNGVPAVGAGNIETAGGLDIYTFHGNAGQRVFFDVRSTGLNVGWQLHSPSNAVIFDKCFACGDPGSFTLPDAGTYKVTVGGESNNVTGTYSFKLWNVPAPQHFAIAIGDTISNGVPSAGAGNIETPGVLDVYTFHANANQTIFADVLAHSINIDWRLDAPDGTNIFNTCTGCGDPGRFTLTQAGTYTLTVGDGRDDHTGSYAVKVWNVPAPQHFAIAVGDTVSNGVPSAGAGNIESPGVEDIYTFHANANQKVYFDLLGNGVVIDWRLDGPDGANIFERCTGCGEPGAFTLAKAGTYTITVGQANSDHTGTYSFKLWNVPVPQHFAIAIGDTISNGVPAAGAGNIESPGVEDVYTFHANAGQKVNVTVPHAEITIGWKLQAPNGDSVFESCIGCGNPGVVTLSASGGYTVTVGQANSDHTGTYSFKLAPQ